MSYVARAAHCELHLRINDDITLYFAALSGPKWIYCKDPATKHIIYVSYLYSLPEVLLLAEEGHELVDAGHALGAVPRVYQLTNERRVLRVLTNERPVLPGDM